MKLFACAILFATLATTAHAAFIHCSDKDAGYFGGFFIDIYPDQKGTLEMHLSIGAQDASRDFERDDELPKLTPGTYQGERSAAESVNGREVYHFDRFTIQLNSTKKETDATVWYDKERKQAPYTFDCF